MLRYLTLGGLAAALSMSLTATAQLQLGGGAGLGFVSDHTKRPYYIGLGTSGTAYGPGDQLRADLRPTLSLGYVRPLSERFYGGAQLAGQAFFTAGRNEHSAADERTTFGVALEAVALFSTSRRGRSWLKVGAPLFKTPDYLQLGSIGFVGLFGGARAERAAKVDPGVSTGPSAYLHYGTLFEGRGLELGVNYTYRRWEVGVGTFFTDRTFHGVAPRGEELFVFEDYVPLTASLAYTLYQREGARLRLTAAYVWLLGEEFCARVESQALRGGVRYEHDLTPRVAVTAEAGYDFSVVSRLGAENVTGSLRSTLGLRYRLGK